MNRRFGMLSSLAVFFVLGSIPIAAHGQERNCSFCVPCPYDPDENYLNNHHISQFYVLWYGSDCVPDWCDEMISCDPHDAEEDKQNLEFLASLLKSGDRSGLREFVDKHPDEITAVPERGIILLRHGCERSQVTLFTLSDPQIAALVT